jgi:hypothetical protein
MSPVAGGTIELLVPVALSTVGVVVGVVLLRRAFRTRRRARALSKADPTPIGDLSVGDYAVVAGATRPTEEGTVEAAILDEEALLVDTSVESLNRRATDTAGTRTTDHESTDAVPFVVEDDTGRVRVELPEEARVRLGSETDLKISHDAMAVHRPGAFGDDVPEGVREYVRNHDTAATYTRWYRQGAVRPGDRIRVAGEVTEGPPGFDSPTVSIAGGSDPSLVAAWNTDDFANRLGSEWVILAVFGAGLSAVGVLTGAVVAGALLW